jgi:Uma2 family endonuclease
MAQPLKTLVSEQEFLATMADELPAFEFVNGEVTQKPMPKAIHQELGLRLIEHFLAYKQEAGGYFIYEGTTNFSQGRDRRYRVPDHSWWAPGRPVKEPNGSFLPPTLAIETRSPDQSGELLRRKAREYRSRGVDVVWLIDPERRTVAVFDDAHDGERLSPTGSLESPLLPGFSLRLEDLWVDPD